MTVALLSNDKAGDRLLALDGLRGIATLLIFSFHFLIIAGLSVPYSLHEFTFLGLRFFFCLSAFLVAKSFENRRFREELPVRNFYFRRALRILPLWWALLLFFLVRGKISPVVFLLDATFVFGFISYSTSVLPYFLLHSWSLFIEELFYALFPWIHHVRKGLLAVYLFVALAIFARIWESHASSWGFPTENWFVYHLPFSNFQYFFLGLIILNCYQREEWRGFWSGKTYGLCLDALLIFYFFLVAIQRSVFDELIVLFIVVSGLHSRSFLHRLALTPAFRWLGVRCYGIYLLHHPFLYAFESYRQRAKLNPELTGIGSEVFYVFYYLVSIGIVLTVAGISFRYFERPLMNMGEKIIARKRSIT